MIALNKTENTIEVKSPYNADFVADLKGSVSGAKWNGSAWVVPAAAEEAILNLLEEHFKYHQGEGFVTVKVTAKNEIDGRKEPVYFNGYPVAYARGRDSGAKVSAGVVKISGVITSSGSVKNWCTTVEEGAQFRLEVAESAAKSNDDWDVELLEKRTNKSDLIAERDRLLARLNEINKLLED